MNSRKSAPRSTATARPASRLLWPNTLSVTTNAAGWGDGARRRAAHWLPPSASSGERRIEGRVMSYGLKDYTGPGPIGGGVGYPSKYKESDAHQIIESLADLNLALVEYGQGKVVWIPNGVTITIPSVYSLSGRRILRDTIRCTIAADRSSGNGGRIKVTAKANGYMTGMWMASHSEIVGLTVEGPGAFEGTTPKFGYAGMCAFRSAGTKGILYENTEVKNFAQGGLKFSGGGMLWNDPERHIVRACEIHGCQRHGFGYGIAQAA